MKIQSPSSSNTWWQCNSEGQIVGTKVTTATDLQNLLSAVNEHFGFSIDSYSTTQIGYIVGNIVPSWTAYEKIIKPKIVAINAATPNFYVYGEISNNEFKVATIANKCVLCDNASQVISTTGPELDDLFKGQIIDKFAAVDVIIQNIESEVVSINQGETVQNISQFYTTDWS